MSENPNSETVQNVQPEGPEKVKKPPPTEPFWEIAEDPETGLYHFVLWSQNNRAMAISGRGYKRRNDATDAIDILEQLIETKPRRLVVID